MENLIIIKQLPIIEEQLKIASTEIDEKVELAKSLVCTEDTVKEIKKTRAELNKDFAALEEKRKQVKNAVLKPYNDFEEIYKLYVSDKYSLADIDLKTKIDTVEDALKSEKSETIKSFFEEYKASSNIDFVNYNQIGLNITKSASVKMLKEQVKSFIDRINDDLALVETQEHKSEIMVEYKKTLNCSQAITTVTSRIKAIEEQKQKAIERKQRIEEEKKIVEKVEIIIPFVEEIKAPVEEEIPVQSAPAQESEKEYQIAFTVVATMGKLKALKSFLNEGGYKYE